MNSDRKRLNVYCKENDSTENHDTEGRVGLTQGEATTILLSC